MSEYGTVPRICASVSVVPVGCTHAKCGVHAQCRSGLYMHGLQSALVFELFDDPSPTQFVKTVSFMFTFKVKPSWLPEQNLSGPMRPVLFCGCILMRVNFLPLEVVSTCEVYPH